MDIAKQPIAHITKDHRLHDLDLMAHTPSKNGDDWQTLGDHAVEVARRAQEFGARFDAGYLGYLVGLMHDLGKGSNEFQQYLRESHRRKLACEPPLVKTIDHKLAGVRLALKLKRGRLAPVILAHHGGLHDNSTMRAKLNLAFNDDALDLTLSASPTLLEKISAQPYAVPAQFTKDALASEFFTRMLFSSLIDADCLDSERHGNPERFALRPPAPTAETIKLLDDLLTTEQERLIMQVEKTEVNRLREKIYRCCMKSAIEKPGVYRLTVPTGGGKTRSGLAFALRHACEHKKDRVIVVIPYTSIIEQTANEYREILGETAVLEHHSTIQFPEDDDESQLESRERWAVMTENWDAPVVVTTSVQFFESLFSNKNSKCRKLHNIANAVVILDEAQTIPLKLLQPILDVLKELVANYGVTLVLCTATQPALSGESSVLQGFSTTPLEIVPDPQQYFDAFARVNYRVIDTPINWERVAEIMRGHTQVLCVVNSKRDAMQLHNALQDEEACYLSTHMCATHRRQVIADIKQRLKAKQPCRVISTQLIECGVNLDFPVVLRAIGPLDRIIQAAGRCNREDKLPEKGLVIIFFPAEGSAPRGVYQLETEKAKEIIEKYGEGFAGLEVMSQYFTSVMDSARGKALDAHGITNLRKDEQFDQVAAKAKVIDQNTMPVLVKHDPVLVANILDITGKGLHLTRDDWQRVQQCTVNIYSNKYKEYQQSGLVCELLPGLALWTGEYDRVLGIAREITDPYDLIA